MGYYTVKLNEESRELTTFILPWGKYQFKHLPFGLSIAPEEFQYLMDKYFADLDYVKIYLDDLLVLSRNQDEHIQHL